LTYEIIVGDALSGVGKLEPQSIQAIITSPPYWGLRNYGGGEHEIGREESFADYVVALADVFSAAENVLKPDGVVWLNLGDIYNSSPSNQQTGSVQRPGYNAAYDAVGRQWRKIDGLKKKDLVGLPWAVGFALEESGWTVHRDYIWHKPNRMPDGARDRPSVATEHVLLLSRSASPFCQPLNRSGILTVNTTSYRGAHFATFPPSLIRPMVRACTRPGDTILDPFAGTGTTLAVAVSERRHAVGIELNPMNIPLIAGRMDGVQLSLI